MWVWRQATASHFGATKKALIGCLCVIALLFAGGIVVHGRPSLVGLRPQSEPQRIKAATDEKPEAARPRVTYPRKNDRLQQCQSVSGTGTIPAGKELWIAHTNDSGGHPDTETFYALRKANPEGSNSWYTDTFWMGVGGKDDRPYWIYAFLISEQAGSAISNVILPPDESPRLSQLPDTADIITKFRVTRMNGDACEQAPETTTSY